MEMENPFLGFGPIVGPILTVAVPTIGYFLHRTLRQFDELKSDHEKYKEAAQEKFADRNEFRETASRAFASIDRIENLLIKKMTRPAPGAKRRNDRGKK